MRHARSTSRVSTLRRALLAFVALMLALAPNIMTLAGTAAAAQSHHPVAVADLGAVFADDTPDLNGVQDGPPPVIGSINLHLTGVLPANEAPAAVVQSVSAQRWPSMIALMPPGSEALGLKRPPKA